MATEVYAGMQRKNSTQVIPAMTWTVITYDTVLGNPPGWTNLSEGLFTPTATKRAIVLAFVHYVDPGPNAEWVQNSLRLCRDPYDEFAGPNTTCTDERAGTPGRTFHGGYAWALQVQADEPLAIQVNVTVRRTRTVQVATTTPDEFVDLTVPLIPEEFIPVEVKDAEFKLVVP